MSASSKSSKGHVMKLSEPIICPDELRREMFKFFYAKQNPEKFDLYKKADASEFLQSSLELIHFCLNLNKEKIDVDSACCPKMPKCLIH